MTLNLLDKIRSINYLLGNFHLNEDFLKSICEELGRLIVSNVYLYDNNGNIVCYSVHNEYYCEYNKGFLTSNSMPKEYMNLTKTLTGPMLNIYDSNPQCTSPEISNCIYDDRYTSIVPIFHSYEKIGAILLIRYNKPFTDEDQIICEHAFAIISLELARREIEEIKANSLEIASANIAFKSLSYSEIMVCREVFSQIKNKEGIIIANDIATDLFITRSIINNALKKLESAGIIVVKSLGVKGTYIKILNKNILINLENAPNN